MNAVQGSDERDQRAGVRRLGALTLLLCSIVAGLMLLEIGCRLARGPQALLQWQNLVLKSRLEARMAHRAGMGPAYSHHATFGFVNTPGYASPLVNHDAQGFRRMPPLPVDAVQKPLILATGNSYTSGDEVADFDAWPARLQQIAGRRTVNAGVAAYGLDQTVLLTEQLVGQLRPGVLIMGFIADDVRRCEMKRLWGREKPYLAGEGSELVLHNVPVPPPPDPRDTLSPLEGALGWSVLVDTVFDRLPWTQDKQEWHMDNARALPSGAGERLACPLMRRIAALGVPTLVVAQYLPTAWDNAASAAREHRVAALVLACAEQAGLPTLDLYQLFADAVRARGREAVYLQWHPNEQGNRLTAGAIARELERRNMLR